jgi:hypothetical protein
MMEVVHTSETSVYFDIIWRYIPEGCYLQTRRCETLKSQKSILELALIKSPFRGPRVESE